MIDWLIELDKSIFLFFNGLHTGWWDQVMWVITKKYTWIPFYLFIVGFIFYRYKGHAFFVLLGIGLTILLADQISSGLFKPFFQRLRPSHEPSLQGLVHLFQESNGNYYLGGKYGFVSSHAANTFGLASFLHLLLRKDFKWTYIFFIWAAIVSYSRIALGVHYPGDIFFGALLGILCGAFSCFAYMYLVLRFGKKTLF